MPIRLGKPRALKPTKWLILLEGKLTMNAHAVIEECLWFIVNTEPRREKTVMGFLVGRGFRPFMPTELRREKRGRTADWKAHPLFPSIVFVPMAVHTGRFDRVKSSPGVLGFMRGTAGSYATIDHQAIDALRFSEISGMDIREIPTGKKKRVITFKPGNSVSFKEGPFGGLYAKIMAVDPRGRISLLLNLFGRETKIDVDAGEIAAA